MAAAAFKRGLIVGTDVDVTSINGSAGLMCDLDSTIVFSHGTVTSLNCTDAAIVINHGDVVVINSTISSSTVGVILKGPKSVYICNSTVKTDSYGFQLSDAISAEQNAVVIVSGGIVTSDSSVLHCVSTFCVFSMTNNAVVSSTTNSLLFASAGSSVVISLSHSTATGSIDMNGGTVTVSIADGGVLTSTISSSSSSVVTISQGGTWVVPNSTSINLLSMNGTLMISSLTTKLTVTNTVSIERGAKLKVFVSKCSPGGQFTILSAGQLTGKFQEVELLPHGVNATVIVAENSEIIVTNSHCLTCDQSTESCTRCHSGFGLTQDGSCSMCIDNTWSNGITACLPGPIHCHTSNHSNGKCSKCVPGFGINILLGICEDCMISNSFSVDGVSPCLPCESTVLGCRSCNSSNGV